MDEKIEKTLEIISLILFIFIVIGFLVFVTITYEMLNDHRCYTMPLNEFYQDKRCEKYWDMRNWDDRNN